MCPTTYTLWPTTAEQKLRQGREIEVAPPAKARVAATHRHSVVAYQHPVELAHWLVRPPHAPYGPQLQSNSSARAGRSRWHCQRLAVAIHRTSRSPSMRIRRSSAFAFHRMDIHGNRNLCNCLPASREQAYPADVPTTYTLWPTIAEQKLRQGREIEVAPPAKARVAATHRHSVVAYQHPVELAHWLVCPPHAPYGPQLQSKQQLRQGREIEVALPTFGSSNPQNFKVAEHAHSQKTSLGDGGQ